MKTSNPSRTRSNPPSTTRTPKEAAKRSRTAHVPVERLSDAQDDRMVMPANGAPPPEDVHGDSQRPVAVHRHRQASVAAILDQTFGELAKCNPGLWDRRAYLMLVGLVYERLATNEHEIATDELIALAKILAENRRTEARLGDQPRPSGDSQRQAANERLPANFADIVRQVYGTNFQAPGETT